VNYSQGGRPVAQLVICPATRLDLNEGETSLSSLATEAEEEERRLSAVAQESNALKVKLEVKGEPIPAIIDCGAEGTFIPQSWVEALKLPRTLLESSFHITLPSGDKYSIKEKVADMEYVIQGITFKSDFDILPFDGDQAYLGSNWLTKHNP